MTDCTLKVCLQSTKKNTDKKKETQTKKKMRNRKYKNEKLSVILSVQGHYKQVIIDYLSMQPTSAGAHLNNTYLYTNLQHLNVIQVIILVQHDREKKLKM